MKPKLTFLLALTFLFLFSGNSFGIDFGKSEEEKFKGTNIGIHICSKINMDIVDGGFQEIHKNHRIIEKDLIRKRCAKKHEKIAERNDWLKGGAWFEKKPIFGYLYLKLEIENKSTDKILTSVTVDLTYKDNSIEGVALNREGKSLKNSRILLLGLAYKKNVDDTRESVTFKIMELLEEKEAVTDYNDPYIPQIKPTRKYKQFVGKKSVALKKINQYDCVVILTDHSSYDFKAIADQSKIIVDTRNACGNIKSNKIIKA